jgi:hypothetical protein
MEDNKRIVQGDERDERWEQLQIVRMRLGGELPTDSMTDEDLKMLVRGMTFHQAFAAWELLMRNNCQEGMYMTEMISVAMVSQLTLGQIKETIPLQGPTLLKCAKLYCTLLVEEKERERRGWSASDT